MALKILQIQSAYPRLFNRAKVAAVRIVIGQLQLKVMDIIGENIEVFYD